MHIAELFIIALGLSMDAFAVALCRGLCAGKQGKIKPAHMLYAGLWFGLFQAAMPLAGYFLGGLFSGRIEIVDHWIAFGLLALIGGKMIYDSFQREEVKQEQNPFAFKLMLVLAVATSIDALAVGVTFGLLPEVNIWAAVAIIGGMTFILSAAAVKLGSVFGGKLRSKAEFAGGVILIAMGLKILIEHLFF